MGPLEKYLGILLTCEQKKLKRILLADKELAELIVGILKEDPIPPATACHRTTQWQVVQIVGLAFFGNTEHLLTPGDIDNIIRELDERTFCKRIEELGLAFVQFLAKLKDIATPAPNNA